MNIYKIILGYTATKLTLYPESIIMKSRKNIGSENMKKAFIENICCEGCARDVKHILESIYGISKVVVLCEGGYALYEGYVSAKVIEEALKEEGYHLVEIVNE